MARPQPRLIAITDVARFGVSRTVVAFERLCEMAAPGSVCVQLRWDETANHVLSLGRQLLDVCTKSAQYLAINERLDVALALRLGAAHLKARSIPASAARRLWSERNAQVWVSRAWHPGDEPLPEHVDAVVVSPVCAVRKGRPGLGYEGLRAAVQQAGSLAVFALGGVEGGQVAPVLATGARGVAAIGACYADPLPLLRELQIGRH